MQMAGIENLSFVIPGRIEDANYDAQLRIGESRDSGSGPSDHPGMTTFNVVREP